VESCLFLWARKGMGLPSKEHQHIYSDEGFLISAPSSPNAKSMGCSDFGIPLLHIFYCEIMHPVELHRDGALYYMHRAYCFHKHSQTQVRSISRSCTGRIDFYKIYIKFESMSHTEFTSAVRGSVPAHTADIVYPPQPRSSRASSSNGRARA